jgi:hypothetical protein
VIFLALFTKCINNVTHISINKQLPSFQVFQRPNSALPAKGLKDVFSLEILERVTQSCIVDSFTLPTD